MANDNSTVQTAGQNGALQNGTAPKAENGIRNVVIIGSGPAGYTAALYTARAGLSPLLIAGGFEQTTSRIKGGQLMFTSDIENFPGTGEGVTGPELMLKMEEQALRFGTEMLQEFVTDVDLCEAPGEVYRLKLESGGEIKTRALIIATGASARRLGIDAEDKFFGTSVSTCATCDGNQFARQKAVVAVVGGGDSAMEEASYLARLEGIPKVYIIHRREEFRASKIMLKRAQDNPKIEFMLNKAVVDINGKPHPLAETSKFFADKEVMATAVLEDTRTGEKSELALDGLFIAIGHTPNTELFKNQLKMDETGYLEHDGRTRALPSPACSSAKMQCLEKVPGVFVAGDVADHVYRQAITAAGMGCQAAIEAERYLAEKMAEEAHLDPNSVSLSAEAIAQSHWGSERDKGEAPIIERVAEAAQENN
ncbi:MAG TPA: FAD-dependent oxidoreductase [Abditibacteriaceae bacterium]|jgi:thioredoxin reductase (NADPH)